MSEPTSGTPRPFRTLEISDPRFETGELRQATVKSAALGQRGDITFFVPAEAKGASPGLIILLHGVYGSHWAWTAKAGAHLIARSLLDAGQLPPCVIAMPSDGLWGDGSGYLPHRVQDFERWIVEDVPNVATALVPDLDLKRTCIAGLSMGGFGALRLAAKFPHRFVAAAGMSSLTHFDQLGQFVEERLGSYQVLAEDRSVAETWERAAAAGTLPALRFDCGQDDPLLGANRELHRRLTAAGIAHTYEEPAGGHEWSYWEAQLRTTLTFFGQALSRARG